MRALIQRVTRAAVMVGEEEVGAIGPGLVVLLGVGKSDSEEDAGYLVDKIVNLRLFPDAQERFDRSAIEVGADLLVISQFTLYASTRKGRRPSFVEAAPSQEADLLFQKTVALFRERGLRVETGRFQQHMLVEIHNDGPVTLMLDSEDRHRPRRG